MDTIIFPPPTATTREMLDFYRREKLKNRQIAHHIDLMLASGENNHSGSIENNQF